MNQKVAGNGILKENKKNWIEISVFAALVAIASAVTFWLFYRQCVESMLGTGLYHSDMKAYILEMQGLDSGYSFPYPVLFKLAATIHLVTASFTGGAELAMALATMLLNSGAMIALKVMLDKHVGAKLQEAMPGKPWLPGSSHRNGSGIPVFCVDGISADRDLSPRYQIQISRGIYAESISQCHLYGGTAVRNSCIF